MSNYLVDGKLPGIGIAVFGGPVWNAQLSPGVYDRHTLTISGMRLEGGHEQSIDLTGAAVVTGFANTNSGGTASVAEGAISVTGGFCYDGHMITFGAQETKRSIWHNALLHFLFAGKKES